MKSTNVLVTGASGYLGKILVNYLVDGGVSVTTLGRKPINDKLEHFSWSLGMSPNPAAFTDVGCVIHLAWETSDRGHNDFHLNVGGSSKLIEASTSLSLKTINISSLSVLDPQSSYGKAKKLVEEINSGGINLRIAKIEEPYSSGNHKLVDKIKSLVILLPIPCGITVQVTEKEQALREILGYVKDNNVPGTFTISHQSYNLDEYLMKYHGLRSIHVPISLIRAFFFCCRASRTNYGQMLHDRWLSLLSTNRAYKESIISS